MMWMRLFSSQRQQQERPKMVKRWDSQMSLFACKEEEDEYYYESDDSSTWTFSTAAGTGGGGGGSRACASVAMMTTTMPTPQHKPFKLVRFFLSHNEFHDDPRTSGSSTASDNDSSCIGSSSSSSVYYYDRQEWWYSNKETAEFRIQFQRERKWLISLDTMVAVVGRGGTSSRSMNFSSLLIDVYGNILQRHYTLRGGGGRHRRCRLDISKAHCRKLAKWLESDYYGWAGLEKLLVPHVLDDLLLGRQCHRDAVLESCAVASPDRLREISTEWSIIDQVLAQTTAVALAMVVTKQRAGTTGAALRLVLPTRVVRR
jgi:hypothetical protein